MRRRPRARYALQTSTVALAVILLSGCEQPPSAEWRTAPTMHRCTDAQMARAENEAAWCLTNTTYSGDYCYGAAIVRNCARRAEPSESVIAAPPIKALSL